MATSDYQRFLSSFFGTGADAALSGPDTAALSRLQGYEQDEAERMMLERLSVSDTRSAVGLGVIKSQKALPRIRELMQSLEGKERGLEGGPLVALSLACYRIDGDPKAIENIIKVLEVAEVDVFKLDAIAALRDSGAPEARDALLRAVETSEVPLIRLNAAKSLLVMAGKLPDLRDNPPVVLKLMNKSPEVRTEAVREFKYMLNG
ncbi:MAG: HEAT repeat domain-containing protein [Polyangiaceae bacterium]|nr:HEAT repeat domain-containing protein [Polyangiaceae bacterium]